MGAHSSRISPQLVGASLLIWALFPFNPYGYYTLLRIVICGIAAFLAHRAATLDEIPWAWTLGLVAVLFNPIIPVYLTRPIWFWLDLLTAIVLLASRGRLDHSNAV